MHAHQHAYIHAYFELCDGYVDWDVIACAHIHIHAYIFIHSHIYIQDYVTALMMGTHSRLGADSPVLLLDPLVAACIAQIIIADKW